MIARYDDEAFDEAMQAAEWYETQQEGLARRFLTKWKEAELRMLADPEINRPFNKSFRKCRFEVFPYAQVYRIEGCPSARGNASSPRAGLLARAVVVGTFFFSRLFLPSNDAY